jgi:ABC-2 type transport system ATP-binding protein
LQNEKIIEVSGLTKKYKHLTAVDGLDLNVYRGDVFGFLGPNGAGKSTTIRMLLSLISPTSGEIRIFGDLITENRDKIMRRIGAIVEKPDFYGYLSAYKNLELLGRLYDTSITSKKIHEILELVGLDKRAKSKVKTFSHGMKQRLGLAQTLLHDPELIILDEPTTGLDPQGMKEIRDLVLLLSKEKGKTIFLSSHILHEVEIVANRMVIINKGKTISEGYVSDLLNTAQMQITFEVNDGPKAVSILQESSLPIRISSASDTRLIVFVDKAEISAVSRYLFTHGIEISAMIPARSLEEYFLKLTDKES